MYECLLSLCIYPCLYTHTHFEYLLYFFHSISKWKINQKALMYELRYEYSYQNSLCIIILLYVLYQGHSISTCHISEGVLWGNTFLFLFYFFYFYFFAFQICQPDSTSFWSKNQIKFLMTFQFLNVQWHDFFIFPTVTNKISVQSKKKFISIPSSWPFFSRKMYENLKMKNEYTDVWIFCDGMQCENYSSRKVSCSL